MKRTLIAVSVVLTMLLAASAAFAAPVPDSVQVKSAVQAMFDDYLKDLELVTNIDSGTGNKEGLDRMAAFFTEKVTALGGTIEERPNKNGTHLIARFKGEGVSRILLGAHMDTVFEKGETAKRPFRYDPATNRAYGPGVADDKASAVQAVYVVKALQELGLKKTYGEIVIHFDAEEEEGSADEESILKELSKQADVALILDGGPANFNIVTQRKGRMVYEMKISGIAAHAGARPQAGASAITELANQISMLQKLATPLPKDPGNYAEESLKSRGIEDVGQYLPENSINVGIIKSSNTKINRVADDAYAKFEFRYFKKSERDRIDKEIRALADKRVVPAAKVEITGFEDSPPMERTSKAASLIDLYRKVVKKEYNADVTERFYGGITVGNYTADAIPTIDGLGVLQVNGHTVDELADLSTFAPRTVALIHFISQLDDKLAGK